MARSRSKAETLQRVWHRALSLAELDATGVKMKRIDGRQIAFFVTPDGIRACNNRCPHEGYPLVEGSLSRDCVLTCNWHNWKFRLDSGENLFGGDRLRVYPVEIRDDEIWVDLTERPFDERYRDILRSLRDAFDDYSYDRIAREIARLVRLGADPLDALRHAIHWSWQKMEFGWTHAYAGMADWLLLYDECADDEEARLVCLVESVAHIAYDVRREADYPYGEDAASFDEAQFLTAIEDEDEARAIALVRGGLRDGFVFSDFEGSLSRAALAHYNDFGHALIYVTKLGSLVDRLGESLLQPLLLSLVRGFVYASREDKIPEFRGYAAQLDKWGAGKRHPEAAQWRGKGIGKSLQAAVACSAAPAEEVYRALLLANAWNLLGFDIEQQDKVRVPVSGNVGWLDFTHGITFASAVRQQCARYPELWPQGLLQMACFNGRNASFTVAAPKPEDWLEGDPEAQLQRLVERLLDHGQGEHIVAVHLLKTALAARREIEQLDAADGAILLAAVQRFFDSPLKRRRARRTAYQSLQFVGRE